MTADEREVTEVFTERYAIDRQQVNRDIEQAVIGGDWGANGYTTMVQADEMGRLVGLGPHTLLLDIGSGRGWPGLYLAAATGCSVVLADLPLPALQVARRRAAAEGIAERVHAVVASAARPPLAAGGLDAVVAADVLC